MARHYSKARNYPEAARRVIKRMHEQVGDLVLDENGLALRGMILRHLVMPGGIAGTQEIMDWVAHELGPNTYVNVMAQYYSAGKVSKKEYADINRHITRDEFEVALAAARAWSSSDAAQTFLARFHRPQLRVRLPVFAHDRLPDDDRRRRRLVVGGLQEWIHLQLEANAKPSARRS